MAVRLNVVVIRPEGAAARWNEAFDDCLGQLLGRPGLDLVLLDRLPLPDDMGTERLAVETIQGDLACLAWIDGEILAKRLDELGKPVCRVAHRRDQQALPESDRPPTSSSAKLYYFDMRLPQASSTILNDLQRLLETRRTPTFQILAPKTTSDNPAETGNVRAESPQQSTSGRRKAGMVPPPAKRVDEPRPMEPLSPDPSHGQDTWDQLLDDLDALDL